MTAQEVLTAVVQAGGRLTPNGEKITVEAPAPLPQDILALVREHKPALLALLTQSAALAAAATAPSPQAVDLSQGHFSSPPPLYPGRPIGAPFRPGHQVWLYRWDDHTPRFDAPVTIVQMRTLWPGEQDIGWCDAAGELSWHNARLAVAVETQEVWPLREAESVPGTGVHGGCSGHRGDESSSEASVYHRTITCEK